MTKTYRAFTLVELLIAIAIVGILVAIAFPVTRTMNARAKSAACLNNLRQIGVAIQLYLGDHNLMLPDVAMGRADRSDESIVIEDVLKPYLDGSDAFQCPSDRELFARTGSSYFWNSALSGQHIAALNFLNAIEDKRRIPMLYDKEGWHKDARVKVNFLYADGHASKELELFTLE